MTICYNSRLLHQFYEKTPFSKCRSKNLVVKNYDVGRIFRKITLYVIHADEWHYPRWKKIRPTNGMKMDRASWSLNMKYYDVTICYSSRLLHQFYEKTPFSKCRSKNLVIDWVNFSCILRKVTFIFEILLAFSHMRARWQNVLLLLLFAASDAINLANMTS